MKHNYKNNIIEGLEQAVCAENTTSSCYKHLISLIKNGKVKNAFRSFSEQDKVNSGLLTERLEKLDAKDFALENKCLFCKMDADSFSLSGAINLGLEATDRALKFYKALSNFSKSQEDKKLFKRLLKEKNRQKIFLKKERKFIATSEAKSSYLENACIPKVISKLWE